MLLIIVFGWRAPNGLCRTAVVMPWFVIIVHGQVQRFCCMAKWAFLCKIVNATTASAITAIWCECHQYCCSRVYLVQFTSEIDHCLATAAVSCMQLLTTPILLQYYGNYCGNPCTVFIQLYIQLPVQNCRTSFISAVGQHQVLFTKIIMMLILHHVLMLMFAFVFNLSMSKRHWVCQLCW